MKELNTRSQKAVLFSEYAFHLNTLLLPTLESASNWLIVFNTSQRPSKTVLENIVSIYYSFLKIYTYFEFPTKNSRVTPKFQFS